MTLMNYVQIGLAIVFVLIVIGMVVVGRRADRGVDALEDRLGTLTESDTIIESLSDVEL